MHFLITEASAELPAEVLCAQTEPCKEDCSSFQVCASFVICVTEVQDIKASHQLTVRARSVVVTKASVPLHD